MNTRWNRSNTRSGDEVLIAVSFERFGDQPVFAPPYGLCKQAVIRGLSTESSASFRFDTCPLSPTHMDRFERLREHGFTAMVAPSDWRYRYPPLLWHDELIVEALKKVEKMPLESQSRSRSGYDHDLARSVMESLNEIYPGGIALIELKYQFSEEPSDEVLSAVLNALRGDGFIDGTRVLHDKIKLNPLERITLTGDGRRHLADEMTKRSKPQPFASNEASGFILAQLLSEFRERKLTVDDLRTTYQGIPPSKLKECSAGRGINEVDFDLAMDDLISNRLVDTGPKEPVRNEPWSGLVFAGFYTSKNEYSYLTEDGYRESIRLASRDRETGGLGKSSEHRSIIHGDQYINYGHTVAIGPHSTGTINFQQQWAAIQNEVDLNALTDELEQLRKHLQQSASSSSDYQRLLLLSEAEEHTKKRNGSKAIEVMSKLGKGAVGVAKDIGTDIAAKVIAKSMGLES